MLLRQNWIGWLPLLLTMTCVSSCGDSIQLRRFGYDNDSKGPLIERSIECGTSSRVAFMLNASRAEADSAYSLRVTRRWSLSERPPINAFEALLDDLIHGAVTIAEVSRPVVESEALPLSFYSPVLDETVQCPCFNIESLSRLLSVYGRDSLETEWERRSDYNEDGIVDIFDLALTLTHFGNCGPY